MPPDPQILRLKDWFSRYDFSVKHIKENHNLIPDFLSRPARSIQYISTSNVFPLIFMVKPLSSKVRTEKFYPPGLNPTTLADILNYAKSRYFYFLHKTMRYKTTPTNIFNPEIPLGGIFELFCGVGWDLCEPTLWLIWCGTVQYSIPIAFQLDS